MQREFLHLAYLLTQHECVIVPGFGAFVVYTNPLTSDYVAGEFNAPVQSLGFNPELKHNDGLLAHSIKVEQQISYKEATLHVLRFSEELGNHLKMQREIAIPGLGKLALSADNKIIFNPIEFPVCNAINYGLNHFQISLLSDLEKQEVTPDILDRNKDVIWIPLNKSILKTAGSVAATVLFFLLFSTPLGNEKRQMNNAVVFAPIVRQKIEIPVASEEETAESIPVEDPLFDGEVANDPTIVSVESNVINTNEIITSSRIYYIIVASLPTQQMAELQLAVIQSGFQQAAVVNNDERFRIYVEKFDNKTEAEVYLEKFRSEYPAYKNAWLLSSKKKSQDS